MFASNVSYKATLTVLRMRKCTAGKAVPGNLLAAVDDKSKRAINYYYYYRHSHRDTFDYFNYYVRYRGNLIRDPSP